MSEVCTVCLCLPLSMFQLNLSICNWRLLLDIITIQCNENGEYYENIIKREIIAALAMSDLTYSKLRSSVPEKGNRPTISGQTFDEILKEVKTLQNFEWWS